MATHSDPTANAAVGSVNREWARMMKKAIALRKKRDLTPEEERMFTGIYRLLLTEPVDVLEKMTDR